MHPRIEGRFIALPHDVLNSAAYLRLTYKARSLLLEVALQYSGHNNGQMLLSRSYLRSRGWHSADTIQSAKDELVEAGFLFETFKGHRPNKASWYACTWWLLDPHPDFDAGVANRFQRGGYRGDKAAPLITHVVPRGGSTPASIGPHGGTIRELPVPPAGPIKALPSVGAVPPGGHHIEMPSAAEEAPS